jgi:hypothetical protein
VVSDNIHLKENSVLISFFLVYNAFWQVLHFVSQCTLTNLSSFTVGHKYRTVQYSNGHFSDTFCVRLSNGPDYRCPGQDLFVRISNGS